MAQDQNKFNDIIKQLELLSKKQQQDSAIIKKMAKQKQQAENQKENQQQKNVAKKLPTILTSAEKRRYQEIGKRFLIGAQTQFNKVKKEIKLKDVMNTTKDFFIKGFEKIKEGGAKLKKSNFWKILLGSLVVIGMAAYLFRDKIAKLIPDATEQTGNVFQRMIKFLGNMLKQGWQFITETLLGSIGGIINRLFNDSIPKMLQLFFYETLPNAIFNTYLMIMSTFDPTAGEYAVSQGQFDAKWNADGWDNLSGDGEVRDEDDVNYVKHLQLLHQTLDKFDVDNKNVKEGVNRQELAAARSSTSTYLMYYEDAELGNKNNSVDMGTVRALIGAAIGKNADYVRQLVKTGKFDAQLFYTELKKGNKTAEDFRKAVLAALDKSQHGDASSTYNDAAHAAAKGSVEAYNKYVESVQGLASSANFLMDKDVTKFTDEQKKRFKSMEEVYLNMSQVFADKSNISNKWIQADIASHVAKFMAAAQKFISDNNGLLGHIKENLISMGIGVAETFKKFFVGSFNILNTVANSIASYINPDRIKVVDSKANDAKSEVASINNEVNGNNIIVNVDLTGNQAIAISDAISGLSSSQKLVIQSIDASTEKLKSANEILVKIGDIHGINMDAWNKLYKLITENRQTTVIDATTLPQTETTELPHELHIAPGHVCSAAELLGPPGAK